MINIGVREMPFDGTEYTPDDPIIVIIDKVGRLICTEDHWGLGTIGRFDVPVPKGRELNRKENRYCPVTAVSALRHDGLDIKDMVRALSYFSRAVAKLSNCFTSTPRYNNAPGRTFSEIKILIAKARELRLADIFEKV